MRNKLSRYRIVGFTLIELIIVIGILVVLASLLLPSLLRAKAEGNRAGCVSNLRQCGHALNLYMGDYEITPALLPSDRAAFDVFRNSPTCDPADYWRKNCSEEPPSPMVGSYAYVRLAPPFDELHAWQALLNRFELRNKVPVVMLCIFHSKVHVANRGGFGMVFGASYPDRVLRLRIDSSVDTSMQVHDYSISMDWGGLFLLQ